MPKRTDINKVLIIGSGPIIILHIVIQHYIIIHLGQDTRYFLIKK